MYIASIFTEARILFSLNHVEFGNIRPMFTEGRILFFNKVEFQNKVLFFTEGSMSFFTMCSSIAIIQDLPIFFLFFFQDP